MKSVWCCRRVDFEGLGSGVGHVTKPFRATEGRSPHGIGFWCRSKIRAARPTRVSKSYLDLLYGKRFFINYGESEQFSDLTPLQPIPICEDRSQSRATSISLRHPYGRVESKTMNREINKYKTFLTLPLGDVSVECKFKILVAILQTWILSYNMFAKDKLALVRPEVKIIWVLSNRPVSNLHYFHLF
eukprot:sb/3471295/